MKFGLVTYLWGQYWDLPTVIANCEKTGVLGVELRTEHAHKVEANLTDAQRRDVKKRFADSKVTLVGLGTNFSFHYPEQDKLRKDIEGAKQYIKLAYDCGASGIKVKPNDLPRGVPQAKTTEQIGKSLNELGQFAAGYGQKVRLEVHGGCSLLPTIKAIMDVVTQPNVGVCWNCNAEDLQGEGLESNFKLVRSRFGDTVHVRELNLNDYPYQQLINLLVATNYDGWVLLEGRIMPKDPIQAMIEQREVFAQMVAKAHAGPAQPAAGRRQAHPGRRQGDRRDQRQALHRVPVQGTVPAVLLPGDRADGRAGHPALADQGRRAGRGARPSAPQVPLVHPRGRQRRRLLVGRQGQDRPRQVPGSQLGAAGRRHQVPEQLGRPGRQDHPHRHADPPLLQHSRRHDHGLGDHPPRLERPGDDGRHEGRVDGHPPDPSMQLCRMKAKVEPGKGHIINSEGVTDDDTWGKRADWCDYYGPVGGEVVGIAIFDHPSNPRHPTWWHVRDYGLFAVNPFGVHDFEKKPAGTGDLVIPAGQSVTFKYRFYFHKGDDKQAKVAEHLPRLRRKGRID